MTEYEQEIDARLTIIRELAKFPNRKYAQEAISKIVYSYDKTTLTDILENYGVNVPLNAPKNAIANAIINRAITEAFLSQNWEAMLRSVLDTFPKDKKTRRRS